MADVLPLKLDPSTGMVKQFSAGDTIATSIAPGSGGGGGSPSVISPAQITSDQNDYGPTGWGAATVAFLTSDSTIRTITGLSSTDVSDGETKRLVNKGTTPIVLVPQHPGSTAANRFEGAKFFILLPKQSVDVIYDATAARWFCMGEHNANSGKGWEVSIFASSTTPADHGMFTFTASLVGTISPSSTGFSRPAAFNLTTGSSSTGVGILHNKTAQTSLFTEGLFWAEGFISIETLSTATERYVAFVRLSVAANTNDTGNNQMGIRYSHDINGGNFQLYCYNNAGTLYTLDTGVAVAVNTTYNIRIEKNRDGTELYGYINGVMVGRLSIAVTPTGGFYANVGVVKTAGTTARAIGIHKFTVGSVWP